MAFSCRSIPESSLFTNLNKSQFTNSPIYNSKIRFMFHPHENHRHNWRFSIDGTQLIPLPWFSSQKGGMPILIQCILFSLWSEINVGLTFINYVFFPRPTALLKALSVLIFLHGLRIFSVRIFFQHNFLHILFSLIFQALRLFKALRLFCLPNFPGPTFIPCPTSLRKWSWTCFL